MSQSIIVIGGGGAGLIAAITAARHGAQVTLIERNQKVGRKLYITGKGRCNVTNNSSSQEVLKHIPRNSRFLTSAITRFPPSEIMEYFESQGVPMKTERGNRVFPVSDRSSDVIDALFMNLRKSGINIVEDRVTDIMEENGRVVGVKTEHSMYAASKVILATGGMSYPLTGSTGDGYHMAEALGHTIVPLVPSLIPLISLGDECQRMQGLALRNISIKVKNQKKKVVFEEQGELLFTHFGLSGPLILSASAHMHDFRTDRYSIFIDLKPALDEQTLDARLLREFSENSNRAYRNILEKLVPKSMVPVLVMKTGIPSDTPANSITKGQRRQLLETLKSFRIDISGPRPLAEAVVTCGGIKVNEVDPKTMESKLIDGLYFAGEILDVDAYTGGFNLQIAWSTGYAAGHAAGESIADEPQEWGI